uniref:ATP-dependent DNA helicase n=1 Tax=Oreochromis niloticus TaxID=8128 RepID=A0A669AV05_ORENI
MPRKSQRSQSQKLRWQKQKEAPGPSHVQVTNSESHQQVNVSQSGEQVKVSVTTIPSPEVQSSAQTATVSYADVVKRGVCSACVPDAKVQQVIQTEPQVTVQTQHDGEAPGPSHVQVTNSETHPRVSSICASRSQASAKYGKYRNQQCMANSLVFLSFLHEDEFITRADLNCVLDKGHAMYSDARKRFVNSVFLACDELPTVVTSRRHEYQVDMSQFARYGTFDSTDHLPSLEQGLQCLASAVRYALLVMGGTVIAVCRLTSGEYAYFDPHPRKSTGMPLSLAVSGGTAVMLKFTRLNDMIDRLKRLYRMFSIAPTCTYELQPVEFHSENAADQRDADENRQTATTVPAPALNEPEFETPKSTEQTQKTVTDTLATEVMSSRVDYSNEPAAELNNRPSDYLEIETAASSVRDTQVTKESVPQNDLNTASCLTETTEELSHKLLKRNKQERRKIRRRLLVQEKLPQRKENEKKKERQTYTFDESFKAKKKDSSRKSHDSDHSKKKSVYKNNLYKLNATYREKQREHLRKIYRDSAKIRERKRERVIRMYKEDSLFREKQKERITRTYRESPVFREKQKERMRKTYKESYRQSPLFKEKQKERIRTYRESPMFQEKQKERIRRIYRTCAEFREKHKAYMRSYVSNLYKESEEFRQKKRSYVTKRYGEEKQFQQQHKDNMRERMRVKYWNGFSFRQTHNFRCAMKIKRKYRQMHRPAESLQCHPDNSLMNEAISRFRSNIKSAPSYVCTVCLKASFPNQVKICKRNNYSKHQTVAQQCLTGKFVHVCDEACNDHCSFPVERKKEYICHTCHSSLKSGRMPRLAAVNGLELQDIPAELCDLNILERHLIAKCIPFAKIIPLPKGRQRLIRGNVVCVPSEVQQTVDCLPRLRNQSQIMRIKLKRRLCYKGHQLFQTVTWSKLIQALRKLKQIHPQYTDIVIRDDALLCDPTLPDDDSSDEASMASDDYDEADLMEIDNYEKDALLSETESESEQDVNMQSCDEQPEEQNPEEPESDLNNGGFALESCLQPVDISEEILCFTDNTYCVAPAERNNPVSFFRTPHLEAMAFPVQFPTGQNTLDEKRCLKLTPSAYFKSRLFNIDARFAKDTNYLFFSQFVTEIHLANSSMTIQLRKGKTMTKDGRKITSGMLQSKTEVEKLVRNKDAVRFMQPLRGTPAYWQKTTRDLFSMVRQIGTPQFFVTFSAAEMRWPEVIQAIKRQQGEEVDFEALDWSEKCEILRSNPVTTMRMFDKRVEALFRDLLFSPAQPLGEIIDYFYRVEFQHRGSPHIHMLLWIREKVEVDVDDDQTVCDFVDRYISAQLPDPEKQPELHKKVAELQKHSKNHTKTCFKSVNSGCRFGFPKPPATRTMIVRQDEDSDTEAAKAKLRPLLNLLKEPEAASLTIEQILSRCNLTMNEYEQCLQDINKKTALILKRDPKDCWINNYNPDLLEAWNSNLDVSLILNAYSCIEYLCKYITKKESGLSEYLKTVIDNSDKNTVNECDEMRAVMQAYSKKREISAQECVTRVCGLKMKKCSRSVVFVPTDDNPVKMSRPMSYLESTTHDSCNIWMTSLSDKYKCRPETPEYEEMSLADFAALCRLVSGPNEGKDVLPLLNQLGFVQRRKNDKPAIIRYYHCSQEKDPEQYYGRLLRLYLPHRSEQELKPQGFQTYQSFYNSGFVRLPCSDHSESVKRVVKRNKDKYEKNSEDIESALEEFEQNRDVVIDEWCNLAPESEVVRLRCDENLPERHSDDENEQENVPDYSRQSDAVTEIRAIREQPAVDPAVVRVMYQNLNQKQACVFYAIRDWCIQRVCGLNPDPFFFYINGGAGTGKSHLIKCIHSEASKILSRLPANAEEADISNPTVLLTSFTGTAAFSINGSTLHSLLKLPRSLKPPIQGLGNQLDEVRCELMNAEIIVIDEISMVSKPLFAYVDARLKQIKGTQRPFGGMSVLAVGDFYQLPPVRQSKPLCVYDPEQIDLWQEHFQMITLTEIMRQKDDVAFAEMLNRIRVKEKTDELSQCDRDLLSQAVTAPEECPIEVLHIYATNKNVESHNTDTLKKLHSNIIIINADDFQKDKRTGRMARRDKPFTGGRNDLPDTLNVAEGARVMLTRNLDTLNGLVNGAFGILIKVVRSENDGHIIKLGLRMDNRQPMRHNRSANAASDDLVYIERAEESLKFKGAVRRQFPVKLAFACTIHKTQGLTTQTAVVSMKNIFEPGMAYVALSRVTSLSGLYLQDLDENKIYANPEVTAVLQTMRQASVEEMMPLLQVRETASRPDTLTLIHHNTEGLPSHISDIKSHHEMCLADVLCLTESHLQGSFVADSLHLDGYTMFKRNRHVSYTNFPHMASRSGGGVVVYLRNHFQVQVKQYLHNVTDLEFLVLKVQAPFPALIAVVYRPPDYSLTPFMQNLVSLLDSLEIMDCHPIIVCGDFNENQLQSGRKQILEQFQSRGYSQLITSATTDKNTLLDLIFVSQPQQSLHSGVLRTYYSYHNPVFCVLSSSQS